MVECVLKDGKGRAVKHKVTVKCSVSVITAGLSPEGVKRTPKAGGKSCGCISIHFHLHGKIPH